MFKTFLLGLILGIAGAAALVYAVPAIDLHREASLITVQPNGGNTESFHINLPQDRILAASRNGNQVNEFPDGLKWPEDKALDGAELEMFKLRNSDDMVVGVAARLSNSRDPSGSFIQWMLHLPARGTMFVRMELATGSNGIRNGLLMVGTREFEVLNGSVKEFFNAEARAEDFDITGRLELITAFVGPLGEAE